MIMLRSENQLFYKLSQMNWVQVGFIWLVAIVGFLAMYSAGGGSFSPWAERQIPRFIFAFFIMLAVAVVDIKIWHRLAYPFYGVCILMLVAVDVFGHIGMGAQRWLNLGIIRIQPSELMKIALVLALARYFHGGSVENWKHIRYLLIPIGMIGLPFLLVAVQPDLGTGGMLLMSGVAMFFLAGVPLWMFLVSGGAALAALPVAWSMLHDYQKQRVLTFMNPESDPLGAGYHIIQSKIALGSGGIFGKGFLEGTQSRLNFLPEKQTDFVFTMWTEETGLLGGAALLFFFGGVIFSGLWMALRTRTPFAQMLIYGLVVNFSLYALINVAMVMGLIPVVGIPLPLISYGGTAMLALMVGFGLVQSAYIHRDTKLPRS